MQYTNFDNVPSYDLIAAKYPTIKVMLFDMDGTLFASESLHAFAIKNIVPAQEISFNEKEIEEQFKGMDDKTVFFKLKELGISMPFSDFEEFIQAKNNFIINLLKTKKEKIYDKILNPKIISLIQEIPKTIHVSVVTASEKDVAIEFIQQSPFAARIEKIFTRDDTFLTKPCSSPYFKAFRTYNVSSSEVLIFEDSKTGLKAAIETKSNIIKASWY
jgi:beta-phosphoglucomutase